MTTFSLYTSFFIARKREVFALRAELLFLSFPKEKVTKKKGYLRAYALKNPPIVQICYAQSRTACLFSSKLRVALRRASSPFGSEKLYEAEKTKSRGDHRSPAPTAGVAVKRDSDGRNPFSHYPCYVELTSSTTEPSPRYTVTFGSSSTVIFDQVGKPLLRIKIQCQHNMGSAK